MKVLLIGSGGREHALAAKLSESPLLTRLFCAPGNPGIAQLAECVAISAMDCDRLIAFAHEARIDFTIFGPETPLVAGFFDRFEQAGLKCLGPSEGAAILEGSKGFLRDLCAEHGIPSAAYGRFREAEAAKRFAASLGLPVVVKADGLAAGKGVIIAETRIEADRAIDGILKGAFGTAGSEIVVEEYLHGEEASFFALTDGNFVLPLIGAQDHKRAFDNDLGPNTGGMGAYSPAPVLSEDVIEKIMSRIVRPTVAAMAARGTPFMGVLYAGLMIDGGEPRLIEYNCRFGDPECQVLMPRLQSDLLDMLIKARDGELEKVRPVWRDDTALTVAMATKGYPGAHARGSAIRNLEAAAALPGVFVYHAGTAEKDGRIVADGGRVLNVTALGADVAEARRRAYAAVDAIDWPEGFCRRDIGWRALERVRQG